jgi:hypothetical protein
MDKFPEAFERFEKRVHVGRIRSFDQLSLAFSLWAGKQWRGTTKQVKALKVEAAKRGIPVPSARRRRREEAGLRFRREEVARAWRFEWVTVKGHPQMRYRDLKTGRFIKNPH